MQLRRHGSCRTRLLAGQTEVADEDRLGGAAVDVFANEPLPESHPLWAYDNVILTPHCSSVYDGWEAEAARMFSENIARYREGAPLDNVVDPRLGY